MTEIPPDQEPNYSSAQRAVVLERVLTEPAHFDHIINGAEDLVPVRGSRYVGVSDIGHRITYTVDSYPTRPERQLKRQAAAAVFGFMEKAESLARTDETQELHKFRFHIASPWHKLAADILLTRLSEIPQDISITQKLAPVSISAKLFAYPPDITYQPLVERKRLLSEYPLLASILGVKSSEARRGKKGNAAIIKPSHVDQPFDIVFTAERY